ncbi:MAG: fimbrial major subunit CsuA/B family protein [Gallionella sp.]|nr:fimbrial major subunit CsuA/B family protein [Gallionella sp.]
MTSIQLKKFAASTIAAAMMFAAASSAQAAAATVSTTFNVDISLSPLCSVTTPANLAFNYTSFQPTPAAASTPFTVTCPNGTPYTVGVTGGATDDAVNLTYNLAVAAPVGGGTGSGVAQSYAINGTIASGQGGTCTTNPCTNALATNNVQTITVSY